MTAADRPRFFQVMQVLAETFGEALSQLRLEAYWRALADLPIDGLEAACEQHTRTSRFFPKPAELRAMFPSGVPDAGGAFAELCAAMCRPDAYFGRPALPSYLATTVERMGGWIAVSRMDRDTLARRFQQVYEPVRAAEVVRTGDARQLPDATADAPRLGEVRRLAAQVGR